MLKLQYNDDINEIRRDIYIYWEEIPAGFRLHDARSLSINAV